MEVTSALRDQGLHRVTRRQNDDCNSSRVYDCSVLTRNSNIRSRSSVNVSLYLYSLSYILCWFAWSVNKRDTIEIVYALVSSKNFQIDYTAGFEPGTQQYIVLAARRCIGPGPRSECTTQNCTRAVTPYKCSPWFLSTCTRWRLDDVLNIPPPPVRLLLWSLRYSVGAIIVH